MPVDAALIPRLREDTLADLQLDYVNLSSMCFDAGQLVGEENREMIRELVLETLVTMLDDPATAICLIVEPSSTRVPYYRTDHGSDHLPAMRMPCEEHGHGLW